MMKKLGMIVILMTLLTTYIVMGEPLKAMLYCYLPKLNSGSQDLDHLSQLINEKLIQRGINVRVHACNDAESALLYSADIDQLFTKHGNDIAEIDVSYIWALNIDLFKFSKDQIQSYYDIVYDFEWDSLTRNRESDQKEYLVGSPGLLCSDFIESRPIEGKNQLSSDFSKDSALARLYLGYHLNRYPDSSLQKIEDIIVNIDDACIESVANFLRVCQKEFRTFDYKQNWCVGSLPRPPFVPTTSEVTSTIGYSQNLFNLIHKQRFDTSHLSIQHITGQMKRKLFYIDAFVAKDTDNEENKKTILDFYEYMLSDEIMNIYTSGLYTKTDNPTYLLSPVKRYYEEATDRLVRQIYESTFRDVEGLTIYQKIYNEKSKKLGSEVRKKLQAYRPLRNDL